MMRRFPQTRNFLKLIFILAGLHGSSLGGVETVNVKQVDAVAFAKKTIQVFLSKDLPSQLEFPLYTGDAELPKKNWACLQNLNCLKKDIPFLIEVQSIREKYGWVVELKDLQSDKFGVHGQARMSKTPTWLHLHVVLSEDVKHGLILKHFVIAPISSSAELMH